MQPRNSLILLIISGLALPWTGAAGQPATDAAGGSGVEAPAGVDSAPLTDAERVAAVLDELRVAYTRLFDRLQGSERAALLIELLESEHPELVTLGVELATRLLLNAEAVGEEVVESAMARLEDADPKIRRTVASLLADLAHRPAAEQASALLTRETDARAASALMKLARLAEPEIDLLAPARSWIGDPNPAVAASAAQFVEFLWDAFGQLPEPHVVGLRATLLELPAARLVPGHVRLLDRLDERDRLFTLLREGENGVSRAAASALVEEASALPALLEAASSRPALVPFAIDAIALHRANMSGYTTARELIRPLEWAQQSVLLGRLAEALPTGVLCGVVEGEADPRVRLVLGGPMLRWSAPEGGDGMDPLAWNGCAGAGEALAEAALSLEQAALAMNVIRRVPEGSRSAAADEVEVLALLMQGLLAEASDRTNETGVGFGVWRAAVEAEGDALRAVAMLGAVVDHFGEALSEAERAWVEAQLAARSETGNEATDPDDAREMPGGGDVPQGGGLRSPIESRPPTESNPSPGDQPGGSAIPPSGSGFSGIRGGRGGA